MQLLKSLLKLILGFVIGNIAIFLFTENGNVIYFWQNIVGIPRPDMFSIRFSGIMPLLYAIIFMAICMIFERAFYEKLKKGHKRCKLVICNVISSTSYEEGEVIVQKMTYDDCYSTMKNNRERLTVRQFFKITELNWSGKKRG